MLKATSRVVRFCSWPIDSGSDVRWLLGHAVRLREVLQLADRLGERRQRVVGHIEAREVLQLADRLGSDVRSVWRTSRLVRFCSWPIDSGSDVRWVCGYIKLREVLQVADRLGGDVRWVEDTLSS